MTSSLSGKRSNRLSYRPGGCGHTGTERVTEGEHYPSAERAPNPYRRSVRVLGEGALEQFEHALELLGVRAGGVGHRAGGFELGALVHQ